MQVFWSLRNVFSAFVMKYTLEHLPICGDVKYYGEKNEDTSPGMQGLPGSAGCTLEPHFLLWEVATGGTVESNSQDRWNSVLGGAQRRVCSGQGIEVEAEGLVLLALSCAMA